MLFQIDKASTLELDFLIGLEDQRQDSANECAFARLHDHLFVKIFGQGFNQQPRHTRITAPNVPQRKSGFIEQAMQTVGGGNLNHIVIDVGEIRARRRKIDLRQRDPIEGCARGLIDRETGHGTVQSDRDKSRDREGGALILTKVANSTPHFDTLPRIAAGQGAYQLLCVCNLFGKSHFCADLHSQSSNIS
ncbi:MAG: hypothetical protein O3B37_00150 [Proteobacteria bacterium]|nr:hypothetical protein [Pseudomonadota bacterium]